MQLMAELPDLEQELFLQLGEDLDVFHLFPDLPTELRLKIWRFARPKPRKVILNPDIRLERIIDYIVNIRKILLSQRYTGLPAILHVNSESRNEILRSYIIVHRTDGVICFDPARDSVQLLLDGYQGFLTLPPLLDFLQEHAMRIESI